MINRKQSGNNSAREVHKPFLTGSVFDERTLKNCLFFFGSLIIVFFIAFIACATASFGNLILRLLFNSAVIILALVIFFNNGSKRGTDDVTRGEILYQKKEKGQEFAESEQRICFHPLKGYVTALIGTAPFLIVALYLALNTSIQTTGAGTLPSWMQSYTRRSDIGNALISYLQPEGMKLIDFIRAMVRIMVMPFVNIAGASNKTGILLIERLSPLILLLPAAAYGTGYLNGRSIRTQVHTAISENDSKRIRKENKRRAARNRDSRRNEPEQLN